MGENTDSIDKQAFLEIPQVPVHCNVLYDNRQDALAVQRGDIHLTYDPSNGMVANAAFDPSLLTYTEDYENSLHFSPKFQSYAEDLAQRLLGKYGRSGKDIIEIGCGKGDFLGLLTSDGKNNCLGFDASYQAEVNPTDEIPGLNIISDFYSAQSFPQQADLLCSRHVLEHIPQPVGFLQDVGQALKSHQDAAIFFEVPNGLWTLKDLGIWDIIYEHCIYFTAPALLHVFQQAGFQARSIYTTFGDQFLCIEAGRKGDLDEPGSSMLDMTSIQKYVDDFGEHFNAKVSHWNQCLAELFAQDKKVVIWGTGSKGVTFLNTVAGGANIQAAIDINVRKSGKFVPGTGQQVQAPTWLAENPVDVVLVMNPIYEGEIQSQLQQLGSKARTLTV